MPYYIREVAQRMGLSTSAIRYYDHEGLLPDINRSNGGIRTFSDADITSLRLIECLKATGMSIKDIRRFIDWTREGNDTIEQRRAMFHERKRIVEEQIAAMERTLEIVNFKCWYYDTAAAQGSEEAPRTMIASGTLPPDVRAWKKQLDS